MASLYDLPAAVPAGVKLTCDLDEGLVTGYGEHYSSAIPPTIERTRNWMFVTWRTPRFVMRVSMKRPDV